MKNKNQLIYCILLNTLSLTVIFVGAVLNILLLIVGVVGLFIGIFILMYWSTVNYKWVCDECGQEFEITLKQNVFGVNAGVNYKSLYCPKCQKKTMCKGIKK